MKRVIEQPNPETQLIKACLDKVDFTDTFSTTNHIDSMEIISKKIFANTPNWIRKLLQLRNFLVKFIGLKTSMPEDYNEEFRVGGYVSFFRIYNLEETETIMGLDDSHLNFRVSIFDSKDEQYNIKVTTLVEYNNRTGRFYMFFVKPFHRVVLKRMVKQAYSN